MLGETLVLTMRELKKWVGRRGVLISSIVTPLIWIALFGKSLSLQNLLQPPPNVPPQYASGIQKLIQQRINELFGTSDYFTYLSAGMLVVFAVFQGMFSGVSVIFDKRLGYMERLLSTPTPRSSIYLSRILATVARITILDAILFATALAMGMKLKPNLTLIDLAMAWLVTILLSIALASAYTTISFYAENQEVLFAASNLINLPLMFSSSALFPIEQMPHWLQIIAEYNPVTYAADLVRYYLIGREITNYWESIVYLTGIAIVLLVLGIYLSIKKVELQ
jgi:ABC-2 type transport system permease protein